MDKNTDILGFIKRIIEISNNEEKSNSEKLMEIVSFLTKITETAKGSIMIKKDRLSMEVAASTNPDLVGIKQPLNSESPSCWVFKNKIPLYVNNSKNFEGECLKKDNYSKSAFLIIPIIRRNEVIGVINLTEKKGQDCFSDEERGILLDLAGIIIGQIEALRLAEELEKNQKILFEKNTRLEKLEKMRNEFFQMMVHDLKGPVSEIIANLDILSYTIDNENIEYVKSAQAGCDTMYTMISNLLDITRLQDGSLKLIGEKICVPEILTEASSRLFATAKNKGVEITAEYEDKYEPFIWGDRGILLRVIQNIIMNAIIHSGSNSILTGFEYENDNIIFYIKDCGKGIPFKNQKSIFDKYFKSENEKTSTGLGLSFCKIAIDAHKGKIWVESEENKGSCFKFQIPELKNTHEELEFELKD
ncbi:MAG: GAF domain-containing sensor histidine kinase [Desulfobacteraceae bacterium]|nr:GAF domain-containing sensor histidine kinase [Desulfobacteraceae bacterium]